MFCKRYLPVIREPCASGNESSHNHILFKPPEIIYLSCDTRLCQNLRCLLERRCRNKTLRRKRCLCYSLQKRFSNYRPFPFCQHLLVCLFKYISFNLLSDQKVCIARFFYLNPSQHLPYDYFNVLIVYLNTLQPVNFMHLIYQIFRQFLHAEHAENIMRIGRTIHKRFSCPYPVPFSYTDMLAFWDEILFRFSNLRSYDNLSLSFSILPEQHSAIYLAYNSAFLWLPCLKEFRDPRQSACDVFGFCSLSRNLYYDIACFNSITFIYCYDGSNRQKISGLYSSTVYLQCPSRFIFYRYPRS